MSLAPGGAGGCAATGESATVQRMQNPDEGRRMLAASFAELGMMGEGRHQAEKVMRFHPDFRSAAGGAGRSIGTRRFLNDT
jgi:hypothetical protein